MRRIESATIFPDGALVTPAADVDIDTGQWELLFTNLPNELDATSLRVSGIASSDLAIESVATRVRTTKTETPSPWNNCRRRLRQARRARFASPVG